MARALRAAASEDDRPHAGAGRVGQGQARLCLSAPVITVAGTNGKGSTCAMLESIALRAGYRVGLYIEAAPRPLRGALPHRRRSVDGAACCPHFEAVEARARRRRAHVLRVHDARDRVARSRRRRSTSSSSRSASADASTRSTRSTRDCAVITSIDIDHIEYLGAIARRSAARRRASARRASPRSSAIRCRRRASSTRRCAIGADLWLVGRDFHQSGDRQQWSWRGRGGA